VSKIKNEMGVLLPSQHAKKKKNGRIVLPEMIKEANEKSFDWFLLEDFLEITKRITWQAKLLDRYAFLIIHKYVLLFLLKYFIK
jgi:hypothetical protein